MNNFIVDLEYLVPLDEISPHMDGHMAYLADGADKGYFMSWGPKVPRVGGVIIAKSEDREKLAKFCATDPFIISGVAKMIITEFIARRPIEATS